MAHTENIDQLTSAPDAVAPAGSLQPPSAKPVSEARRRAARENGSKSKGPVTPEGKAKSCLNATRHGLLSHVIHLPEQEMASYTAFTDRYVAGLSPVGPVETQLANACADLQFRLHRAAAAEHNLFALGHEELGDTFSTGHPESHAALTMAETLRRNPDPLHTLTLYEARLNRRFLQTLKQLRELQAERRALEQQQLQELAAIAQQHPRVRHSSFDPVSLGFVCSKHDWRLYFERFQLLTTGHIPSKARPKLPHSITSRHAA